MTYCIYNIVMSLIQGQNQVLYAVNINRVSICLAVHKAVLPEVLSSFTALVVEFVRQAGYKVLEMGELQSPPYLIITVAVKRIEVHPQRT